MLHDIQEKFLHGLLNEDSEEILSLISSEGKFSPKQRYKIYQNNTKLILTDILQNLYPVACEIVGHDFFKYAAFSYIKEFPPDSGDMSFYGKGFPSFLKSLEPLKEIPYIYDIAKLEWNWYLSGVSASILPLAIDKISTISEEDIPKIKFNFQPHVILLKSSYAIDKLWKAITDKEIEQISKIELNSPTHLIIHRLSDTDITFLSIDEAEYTFAKSINNNNDFQTATNNALEVNPEFSPDQILMYFLSNQMLTAIE